MKKFTVLLFMFVFLSIGVNAQWTLQSYPQGSGSSMLGKTQFVSATEGWIACGSNGSLLHTTNAGATWNVVTPFPNETTANMSDPALTMSWINPTHGWALKTLVAGEGDITGVANGAVIYRTTDGGNTWVKKSLPITKTTTTYSMSDLQGNWQFHGLTAKNPVVGTSIAGWMYGTATINAAGACSLSESRSNGANNSQIIPMSVSSYGKMSVDGEETGFMSVDKSTLIMTGNEDNDGYSLYVMQKQIPGTNYTSSDFQGTWQMHSLSVGTNTADHAGWVHAQFTGDASGNLTGTVVGVGGDGTDISTTSVISPSGEITGFTSVFKETHGFMSADKKTFFMTMTGQRGDFNLAIFQKVVPGTTYSTADLQGKWQTQSLISMNPSNTLENNILTSGWISGVMMLNSSGEGSINYLGQNNRTGNDDVSILLSSAGISTPNAMNGSSQIHGFMSADKNTTVQTMIDEYGGYEIGVMQRDLSLTGDVGLQVQFADENTGWVSVYNELYSDFKMYKTTDGGNTWNLLSNTVGGIYQFVDASNGWMIGTAIGSIGHGNLNTIYRTTNGGATWTVQASNIGIANAICFSDLLHGWVVGRNGLLLKTTDGGNNWTSVNNAGFTSLSNSRSVFFLDTYNGWIGSGIENTEGVGTRFIIATKDGGTTWTTQNTPVTNSIFSISFWDQNNGWFISDHGQIAHFTNAPLKSITVSAGGLSAGLTGAEKSSVMNLKVTGTIDARDFKTMRDDMPLLSMIDLSGTTIDAYSGTEGTRSTTSRNYQANALPSCSFYNSQSKLGKTSLTSFVFPASVTTIESYAFDKCTGLTSIDIPTSVTSIGYGAFSYTGLMNVSLPNGLAIIGDYAFHGCDFLNSVSLSSSVSDIGYCAFNFEKALKKFDVSPQNPYYSTIDGVLFTKDQKVLVRYPDGKGTDYMIPMGVNVVDTAAFEGLYNLQHVVIPSTVSSLKTEAFYWCPGLKSIELPASVNAIGSFAFYNCSGLTFIRANATTPVNLNASDSVFSFVDFNSCILYVPMGSKSAYQAANQWRDFVNIIEISTSIPAAELESVNLYPNPTSNGFYINGVQCNANVSVFNLNGMQILSGQVSTNRYVDISTFPQGMYIVKVTTPEGMIQRKLVKN